MRRIATATALALVTLVPAAVAAPAMVDATDRNTFEPAEVTVNVGEAVTWRFVSARPHYVLSDPGSAETLNTSPNPSAPALRDRANPRGSTASHTFATPGRFTYNCPIHVAVGMRGVVNVVGRTAATTAAPNHPALLQP
jgi:plastocyanin